MPDRAYCRFIANLFGEKGRALDYKYLWFITDPREFQVLKTFHDKRQDDSAPVPDEVKSIATLLIQRRKDYLKYGASADYACIPRPTHYLIAHLLAGRTVETNWPERGFQKQHLQQLADAQYLDPNAGNFRDDLKPRVREEFQAAMELAAANMPFFNPGFVVTEELIGKCFNDISKLCSNCRSAEISTSPSARNIAAARLSMKGINPIDAEQKVSEIKDQRLKAQEDLMQILIDSFGADTQIGGFNLIGTRGKWYTGRLYKTTAKRKVPTLGDLSELVREQKVFITSIHLNTVHDVHGRKREARQKITINTAATIDFVPNDLLEQVMSVILDPNFEIAKEEAKIQRPRKKNMTANEMSIQILSDLEEKLQAGLNTKIGADQPLYWKKSLRPDGIYTLDDLSKFFTSDAAKGLVLNVDEKGAITIKRATVYYQP